MGTLIDIQLALDSKLSTLSPAVSTAWPNTKYKPTENTSFLRPTLLSTRQPGETLSGGQYHKGIYQIDIFVPLEKGVSALLTIEDNLYTLFRKTTLTKNSTVVWIKSVNRGPTQRDDAWYHGIIEVEFTCFDQ